MANDIIKFGTDGWRAIVNEDFNNENVLKVINSIAIYIYKKSKFDKPVLIGYDPRNKADEFAQLIAKTLSEFGFNIILSDKIVATPVLAFASVYYNAYSLMLTASHNPPEYLGIKFIPEYGGPATDDIVSEIVNNIGLKFDKQHTTKKYVTQSFDEIYYEHIKKLIDFDLIKKSNITINYDGHHGAAAQLFKRILDDNNIKNNCLNMNRDINFGGFMPDPKEKYLPQLKEICKNNNFIGLSNDGDGDRYGVFNENGEYITPNEIMSMLLIHLIKNKKLSGKLAKTIAGSYILDEVAKSNNVDVIETQVGFKWLGEAMRNNNIILAGEDSGGLSIKNHIPEKDGIIANLLIIEMICSLNKTLVELQKNLHNQFGTSENTIVNIKLNSTEEQEDIINQFANLNEIEKLKIIKKTHIGGLKLFLDDNKTWLLIRKSGTEPLLRIYIETTSNDKLSYIQNVIKNQIVT